MLRSEIRPQISLAMIVKNEAEHLPRCLESVRAWVDEIVVVDTGSTDDTPDIAKRYGARIFEWAWRDDFAAARNESLRHARGVWIFVLDADEVLLNGDAVRATCAAADPQAAGYTAKIVSRCPFAWLTVIDYVPRLFRKLPGVGYAGLFNEEVGLAENLRRHGRLEDSTIEIAHAGYVLTAEQMRAKAIRNLGILTRQVRDEPERATAWFKLAQARVMRGDGVAAVDAYLRGFELVDAGRSSVPISADALGLQLVALGAVFLQMGNEAKAIQAFDAALAVSPQQALAHVLLGVTAGARGAPAEAERHFAAALELVPRFGVRVAPWVIHFLLAETHFRHGRHREAVACYEATLALNPAHEESRRLLDQCRTMMNLTADASPPSAPEPSDISEGATVGGRD